MVNLRKHEPYDEMSVVADVDLTNMSSPDRLETFTAYNS